mmetsp:Transcript_122264/g.351205  ORF Transcript_122264/g.351205 Transcript_122264/m.351205 type:complete len:203 (-) Transcript_122264:75-683(-)
MLHNNNISLGKLLVISVTIILALGVGDASAFLPSSRPLARSSSHVNLLDPAALAEVLPTASHSFWISTIDSDIASIPNDQFGLVFAGGIMVMFGGVLSAVIVGFLLEKGDLYASIAAESYLQSAEDEEFWKGLSQEEQGKAREMMDKIKGADGSLPAKSTESGVVASTAVASSSSTLSEVSSSKSNSASSSQPTDMFSDYGD